MSNDTIINIPLSDLREPSVVIRTLINMESVRELAESIREKGVLQPILVRLDGDKYEIIAGHRRYLACKLLSEKTIPAIVKDLPEEEVLIMRAMENIQREDLSPLEEAKVYGMLRDLGGLTVEEISRKIGRSRITVKKYLTILELPEDIQKAVDKKLLPVTTASILSQIDDPELRNYYLHNAVEHGCSVKTAEQWVAITRQPRQPNITLVVGVCLVLVFSPQPNQYTMPAMFVFPLLKSPVSSI